MFLATHPVNRLISDVSFWTELMSVEPETDNAWATQQGRRFKMGLDIDLETISMQDRLRLQFYADHGKIFLVTNTVMDKLTMLKCKYTKDNQVDWSVFRGVNLKHGTYILPNREVMRIREYENMIRIAIIEYKTINVKINHADMMLHLAFIDKETYSPCSHMVDSNIMHAKAEFIFKMMAFIFLSEIEEEILKPGQSKGTKKQDKTINTLGQPITIINSKWNITAIRNESFGVSGHFAIRWCGQGRTEARVVWIDPFQKNGYIRKAAISKPHE